MAKKFLTLNIGAATVELAEYDVGAKGALTLLNYGTAQLAAPIDAGNAETILSPALLEIVREKGIKPGKVAMSVSGQMVFPRFAAIPATGGEERFEQLIRYEIEQNIPFPIDEMVCDRQIVGDTAAGDKSVMIVAAKIDQIEALTSAVQAAGFTPEVVDAAPIALVNAAKLNLPNDGACVVLLDIGAKTTSLIISEQDRLYNRSIPVAGNTITKEIANALGCSPAEAEQLKREKGYVSLGGVTEDDDETADRIAKVCRAVMTRLNAEVSRSINFYRSQQGGRAPDVLYLTGGSALLPQLDVFFSEALQIPVQYFNPFEAIKVGSKVEASALEADGALIAATVGLAAHAAGTSFFNVNLLPPRLVEARAEKAKIPFVAAGGVLIAGALVLAMLSIGYDTELIVAERDAVQVKLDSLSKFDREVKAAQEAEAEATAAAEKVRQLMNSRALAVQRLNAVRSSLLPGMWIDKCDATKVTIRYWKDRVKVSTGKTVSETVVDKLKRQTVLDGQSVKIADMSSVGADGQLEQFTVEMKLK